MGGPVVEGRGRQVGRAIAQVTGLVVLAVAVAVLVGWVLDVRVLKSLLPQWATMKVNTALGLGLSAVYLLASSRTVRRTIALAVMAIAGLTLVEMAASVDLGIDQLLLDDPESLHNPPGRMAFATALALFGLASSHLALTWRRYRLAELLLLVPAGLSGLAVLGYAFGVGSLYGIGSYSTMAAHTALALSALALGTAGLVPGGVLQWAAAGEGLGSVVVRRLLPVTLLFLPVLGYTALLGSDLGLYGERFAHALIVALGVVLLATTSLGVARQLEGVDSERLGALRDLGDLNASLQEGRDAEWRRAEALSRDLEQEHERFQRAIGKVDDLVWTVELTPSGLTPVRLVFASPNATGIFGAELPEQPHGVDTFVELVHPDDLPAGRRFLDELAAGRHSEVELRLNGLDGQERWLWLRGSPRNEDGRMFVDGIATNITERQELARQREEMLLREQEQVRTLRELNRLREEFLATAGHELRSPLTSVLGFAELLQEDAALTGEQRRYAQVITERTRQLSELVGDMFDLTRLEAGMAALEPEATDLADLVADAVSAHAPAAAGAGVEMSSELDAVKVYVDPMRFRQVLDNLLSNAVRYSSPPGVVRVSCGREGQVALLRVADDGIGIPEGEVDRVFDRLYRASNATGRGIRGTGLGLALTRAIVEAHDGTVAARPNPGGRGTVFEVRLPLTAG